MINKKQFKTYVGIQMSGVTNMWDVNKVIQLSGYTLDKKNVMEIMEDYAILEKKYNIKDKIDQKQENHKINISSIKDTLMHVINDLPSITIYKFKKDKELQKRFDSKIRNTIGMLNILTKAKMK